MKLKEKWKKKYIGDRSFYRRYLLLAVPMILQNAITNLVSFLDNIMVGQLGTEQMDICIHFALSCMRHFW